ncbi:maleylpyruvate isomerase family mycothiol-dependent enzyme [Nocardioides cavernae]|uniref:maleylpyruvate isomerase family mycothiol-dependent enzyme n=1 Tax=Nocardioides TaxID=1839 RepID=UPI00138EE420|nr:MULTISPECIES: maleylpyruvate isomerase family mycothiol-dependent enzyme [Nocardioides]MCK9823937.1 maleylpyruvate isomerase family mycothiol-dependent enzyme [Nocardioides cavernae]
MTDLTTLSPDLIARADRELVRTVDGLPDEAYAEPSLLPGWTRAHVIAHLTLNAEGLGGVLHGAHLGETRTMYASQEARNGDIDDLAAVEPTELRERFLASTGAFNEALEAMADGDWDGRFDRTPGGRSIALVNVPLMRLREVEIHHADLDAGYAAADWDEDFCAVLLESLTKVATAEPFTVRPTDLDGSWRYGEGDGGPVVTGTAAALGWWLTGRGSGEGLTSDTGTLPEMEAW